MDILSLFACFETFGLTVQIRRLAIISRAILTMTGRITMLSISRWTSEGGSYRTIQRFFATRLPWAEMKVKFFKIHLFNSAHEYLVAGDETVIGKVGRETFGVDRFFSGLSGKVIRGLSFFVVSLVDTVERKAYPLCVEQRVKSEAERVAAKSRKKKLAKKVSGKKGRRKGSRNRNKKEFKPSAELLQINKMLSFLVKLARRFIKIRYLALDGHFGHQQ